MVDQLKRKKNNDQEISWNQQIFILANSVINSMISNVLFKLYFRS